MKKNSYYPKGLFIAVAFLPISSSVEALDFSVQPRFETGLMYYDFSKEPGVETTPQRDPEGELLLQANTAEGRFEITDTIPFIGGGATIFVNRFFVDLSGQYAFDGNDDSFQTSSTFGESSNQNGTVSGNFFSQFTELDADFDRTDYAVSVGFAVTPSLALFGGYKRSETDFELDRFGSVRVDSFNSDGGLFVTTANFVDKVEIEVEQDGPFVGLAYGLDINKGFMRGGLTTNLALAFLDSEIKQKLEGPVMFTNQQQLDVSTGLTVDFPDVSVDPEPAPKLEGDTVGLSLGMTWRGLTPIQGLIYNIGISGYNYSFDGDTALADFEETVINFKAGIGYSF